MLVTGIKRELAAEASLAGSAINPPGNMVFVWASPGELSRGWAPQRG